MSQPTVFVIDDDASVRKALVRLINAMGMVARAFVGAEDFLDADLPPPGCLVVDVSMPGMTGLELQRWLIDSGNRVPLLFISAWDDPRLREAALSAGAIGFLIKPFQEQAFMEALYTAVAAREPRGN